MRKIYLNRGGAKKEELEIADMGDFNLLLDRIKALEKILKDNSNVDVRQDIKDKYSVGQLKQLLKDNGVKGYSKLREAELVDLVLENNIKW